MEFVDWARGRMVGQGSFATVNLVVPTNVTSQFSPTMVVKSSRISHSESLRTEKEVLSRLGECPEIVRFLGDGVSYENYERVYNLFFEYAEKGSLENHLRNSGGRFRDWKIRRYTKSILKGLSHIHDGGYVHCDIKLSNILLFDNEDVKIADFGLATRVDDSSKRHQLKGTPLYMSPELVNGGEARSPADVWALGCAVVHMVTGKSAWEVSPDCNVGALICRIGLGKESPEVPVDLCSEGRDFIEKCFIKDPSKRWTARMLLDHPFVNGFGDKDEEPSVSPRDPFEFLDSELEESSSFDPFKFSNIVSARSSGMDPFCNEIDFESSRDGWSSPCNRLREIASDIILDWSDSYEWISVRCGNCIFCRSCACLTKTYSVNV